MQYLISEDHVGLEFAKIQLILTIGVNNSFTLTVLKFQSSQDQDQVILYGVDTVDVMCQSYDPWWYRNA